MSKPVFQNVLALSGRRNRKSYFLFLLASAGVGAVLGVMVAASAGSTGEPSGGLLALAVIAFVGLIIAGWTVGAQRCRDFGWTGWAVLISAAPVVGWIFPFVMLFVPGTVGPNRYGPDPLADGRAEAQMLARA